MTWASLLLATLLSGRFAIVATAGEAAGQTPLQYVDADADRVRSVLEDLGSVESGHVLRLRDATPASIRAALASAEAALRGDPQAVLVLYFSGHADEQGLLLGSERLDYRELRQLLARSTVRTRVVLLDACRSGGVLTSKGGRQAAAFDVSALRSETVSGAAIIAASTALEPAQESSRLEGSFFTHHLVSGLRGAADQNADGGSPWPRATPTRTPRPCPRPAPPCSARSTPPINTIWRAPASWCSPSLAGRSLRCRCRRARRATG